MSPRRLLMAIILPDYMNFSAAAALDLFREANDDIAYIRWSAGWPQRLQTIYFTITPEPRRCLARKFGAIIRAREKCLASRCCRALRNTMGEFMPVQPRTSDQAYVSSAGVHSQEVMPAASPQK